MSAAWLKLYHFIHTALQRGALETEINSDRTRQTVVSSSSALHYTSTRIPLSS